jgi:predicted transcriptional regulator
MTIRVDAETEKRLKKLAKATSRTRSFLAAEAVRAYVDNNEWQIQEIERAVREAEKGRFIEHGKVAAWLASWGTRRERKRPG